MVDFPAQSLISFRVAVNKNPTFSREKAAGKIHHRLKVVPAEKGISLDRFQGAPL